MTSSLKTGSLDQSSSLTFGTLGTFEVALGSSSRQVAGFGISSTYKKKFIE